MESEGHRFLTDRMVFSLWGLMNRRDAAFANSMALNDFSASFVAGLIRLQANRLSSMNRMGLRTKEQAIKESHYCSRPHAYKTSVKILMWIILLSHRLVLQGNSSCSRGAIPWASAPRHDVNYPLFR